MGQRVIVYMHGVLVSAIVVRLCICLFTGTQRLNTYDPRPYWL